MFLPYISALKEYYSDVRLDPSGSPVGVSVKNPQHGFKSLNYPGIGIEYVTSVLNWNRENLDRRVTTNRSEGTAVVQKAMEPIDYLFYVHTFVKDNQAQDLLLTQKMMEKTPYYFSIPVTHTDQIYNIEVYREEVTPVDIEGLSREFHNVWELKLWGWVDIDPEGIVQKIVTQDPELNSYIMDLNS